MTTTNHDAKFTFLYLLSLVALIFTALATGIIFFQVINKLIPDAWGVYGGVSQEPVRFAIAALLVAGPVYYWAASQLNKNLVSGSLPRESAARRWLTYLIMFVAAVVSLGWLIATLTVFFDGDLTLRFILKLLTVLSIANLVFGFYFYDIKRQVVLRGDKKVLAFLFTSLLVVVSAFVVAWFVVDSPALARAKNHDRQVLNDFNQIDNAINGYLNDNNKLPTSLDELVAGRYYLSSSAIKDEANGQTYEYQKVDEERYQLCAEFKTDNQNQSGNRDAYFDERWPHASGRQCLTQRAFKPVPAKQ